MMKMKMTDNKISKSLSTSLQKLDLHPDTYTQLQKFVILYTRAKIERLFNYQYIITMQYLVIDQY
jgi:hypothetical protein